MRLWYQSLTRPDAWPAYNAALRRMLEAAADPGTEFRIGGITRRGGVGDQYRSLEFIETIEVLDNVAQAEAEGFDAVLLGNIADPGLRQAREMATIPVLGLCETALFTACQMGASIGLVVANDKHFSRVQDNIAVYGLGSRVACIERMAVGRLVDLDEAFRDGPVRQRILDQFLAAAATCVARGAEVVIPAAGVAMVLVADAGIHEAGPKGGPIAPVLNAAVALLKQGETVVKLNRLMGGKFTSRRGAYAQPPAEQIAELRAHYGSIFPRITAP
jgi:allantoin racemase